MSNDDDIMDNAGAVAGIVRRTASAQDSAAYLRGCEKYLRGIGEEATGGAVGWHAENLLGIIAELEGENSELGDSCVALIKQRDEARADTEEAADAAILWENRCMAIGAYPSCTASCEAVANHLHGLATAAAKLEAVAEPAAEVMDILESYGEGIVAHLMDTDDNAGQRLREALAGQPTPETKE